VLIVEHDAVGQKDCVWLLLDEDVVDACTEMVNGCVVGIAVELVQLVEDGTRDVDGDKVRKGDKDALGEEEAEGLALVEAVNDGLGERLVHADGVEPALEEPESLAEIELEAVRDTDELNETRADAEDDRLVHAVLEESGVSVPESVTELLPASL
jgi:hypothetical protein